MSVLFTILAIIAAAIVLILLSFGLFIFVGVLVLVLGVAAVIGFMTGGMDFSFRTQNSKGSSEASHIPQEFNACLLGEELDVCREKFTIWTKEDMELIRQLSRQVKEDLGKRVDNSRVIESVSENVNGDVTITLDQETDFAKKKAVHEHYQFKTDPDDDKHRIKISELKWTY